MPDLDLIADPLPAAPSGIPAARAGDFMRAGDSLRLALELVEAAADHIERREGSKHPLVLKLRRDACVLRARP